MHHVTYKSIPHLNGSVLLSDSFANLAYYGFLKQIKANNRF